MTLKEPRVSVLIPCRNAESTVEAAIESVICQHGVVTHVIAVDDGSTDRTGELLNSLAAKHDNITLLRTPGLGIVRALNLASENVESEFVARLDADDLAHEDRFAEQVDALERDASLGVVGTQTEAFPADVVGDGLRLYLAWQNALLTKADHARCIFVESPLCHPSTMMRRAAYESVGRYHDVPWAEDYDLWLRMHAAGFGMAKVPRVLTRWRRHDAQLTFTDARYTKPLFRRARAHYLAPVLRAEVRPLVVWGAGPTGKRLARELSAHGLGISRFIDIDPEKIGRQRRGLSVIGPESLLPGADKIVVAVGARGARDLIRDHLLERRFQETRDFILAS